MSPVCARRRVRRNPVPRRADPAPGAASGTLDRAGRRLRRAGRDRAQNPARLAGHATAPPCRACRSTACTRRCWATRRNRPTPVQAQLQQAKWMIRNVEQRFDILVSQAIVERQTAFFSQGPAAATADPEGHRGRTGPARIHDFTGHDAEVHAHPVWHAGAQALLRGGVSTDGGDATSATAVQTHIRQMVATCARSPFRSILPWPSAPAANTYPVIQVAVA